MLQVPPHVLTPLLLPHTPTTANPLNCVGLWVVKVAVWQWSFPQKIVGLVPRWSSGFSAFGLLSLYK